MFLTVIVYACRPVTYIFITIIMDFISWKYNVILGPKSDKTLASFYNQNSMEKEMKH